MRINEPTTKKKKKKSYVACLRSVEVLFCSSNKCYASKVEREMGLLRVQKTVLENR